MTLKHIFIARHGYRMNWLPEPHPPNPTGIDSDPPLAPHGVDQAVELARYIHDLPAEQRPGFILTSPFYRCVETARPIALDLGIKVALERGVGEYYQVGRSVIPEPANYDRLTQFFPGVLVEENDWPRDTKVGVVPNLGGETPEACFERCQSFWDKFIPVFENLHPEVTSVLIITHAATAIALGMALLGRQGVFDTIDGTPNNFIRAGACSLSHYDREGNTWAIKVNGDCSFMKDGEEMNWNFHSGFEAGSDEDIKSRQKQQEEEEMEDFYVTIEVPNFGKRFEEDGDETRGKSHIIKPSSQFQITELNNPNPMWKISNNHAGPGNTNGNAKNTTTSADVASNVIDGKIYRARWHQLVGTDLIFDDYGELIGKVNEHLVVDDTAKLDTRTVRDERNDDEVSAPTDNNQQAKTAFLRKAIKAAKKLGNHRAATPSAETPERETTPMEVDE